ncbi:hypothetical protein [Mycobacterium sp. 29Ha]|uniref:hypothetical protein n=1 Tax=Mycobacterium sp. 29Ha TaxID=2939268 RepID=UPI002938DA82|nr:hypothetical protein [Mycobacterium sp. 29Ha]MDV3136491.1 hypothetical protein [Mycobacterium sp. 29Ha]
MSDIQLVAAEPDDLPDMELPPGELPDLCDDLVEEAAEAEPGPRSTATIAYRCSEAGVGEDSA